ncbi:MAG: hypothetical protein OXE41_04590 [Gammaproteobacteria bacterium]|nr:hypothetical protein [Gammaproteobacteria bacterium]
MLEKVKDGSEQNSAPGRRMTIGEFYILLLDKENEFDTTTPFEWRDDLR